MQNSILFSVLIATTSVFAAPAPAPELNTRIPTIPVGIYQGPGCNDPTNPSPVTTVQLPTDNQCFGFSPIISGNTDSALINTQNLARLPAGCSVLLYSDSTCTSQNVITFTQTGQCATFGARKLILSAKTVGTCA